MTVRQIRKEMGFDQMPPSNDAPMAPQMPPMQEPEVPDHAHPEYDAMMVKLQELESALQAQTMGGINQESLDSGKPEDDKGKPTGGQEPLDDTQGNWEPKKVESFIRKIIREELKGVPERDTGKDLQTSGPSNTNNVPQTKQPSVGEAPSGGEFDSDDKTNKGDGDEAESKVSKPASNYPKPAVKKNRMEMARQLIERAKKLMNEANEPDPSEPMPGKVEDKPKQMDGQAPSKNPMGGTESETIDDGSEDPEANVPNSQRPLMKEQDDEENKDDEEKDDITKVFEKLKKEVRSERFSRRESLVGMSSPKNGERQQEFLTTKERANSAVKQYLEKAGHNSALAHMTR